MEDQFKRLFAASKDILIDRAGGAILGLLLLWFLPGWMRCFFMFSVSVMLLSSLFAKFITYMKPRKRIDVSGKSVLISGCDSGFGNMLATRLDDLGFQVFAGCLSPDGEGARKLQKSASSRLHIIGMDVSKDEDVEAALEYVKKHLGNNKFWAVVCNAGMNDGAEVLWSTIDAYKNVINVNFMGTVRVTKAFLPLLCKSKGRVAVVASSCGRFSFRGMSGYCASKHAIISFCDSLRLEMYRFGVQVSTIEPWMYKTGITSEAAVTDYGKKAWDKAPEDIKAFYPSNYLDGYTRFAHLFVNEFMSYTPMDVVSCLEEAVVAEHPRYSYCPGKLSCRALFWVMERLPQQLFNLIILSPDMKK